MQLELFINFDGNCREAVDFYAKVFNSSVNNLMTYGDAPPDPDYTVPEADKNRIMYAGVPIGNIVVMFSDVPTGSEFVSGNNINPTISTENKDDVTQMFNDLKEGGEVLMELQQTFFSEWFGMVKDKYGVTWQILQFSQE
ncbi:MAG: VOC family protein [Peptococcaceae bacterium]|nr:VOC family protein [Peptococcaceae bacterium]